MGEIWRLETSTGKWAIKALFPWADRAPIPFDVQVQQAARDAGIPLPLPIVTADGAVLELGGRAFRAYEWVELAPTVEPPIAQTTAHEAGRLLGQIHTLGWPLADSAIDDWYVTTRDEDEWQGLAARASRAGAHWAAALTAHLAAIRSLRATTTRDHAEPILCHRDFNRDNVLPEARGQRLYVLDWENVGPLAADQELATALHDWTCHRGALDRAAAHAFLAGYRDAGARARLDPEISFSTLVTINLNFLWVMAEQSLDAPEHREFADLQVHALLDGGLDHLATALDALREFATV
jgi:Ser/Thr protein kinase RdoA (MazF antagonist)